MNPSERIQPQRLVIQVDCFVGTPLCNPHRRKPHVGARIVRVEFQRRDKAGCGLVETGSRAVFFPHLVFQKAQRGVRIRQIGIELECFFERCFGNAKGLVNRKCLMIVQQQQHAVCEPRIGLGILRVQRDRLFELLARSLQRDETPLVEIVASLRVKVVRGEAVGGYLDETRLFFVGEGRLQCSCNFRRNFALYREQVRRSEPSVIRLRPDVLIGRCINELGIDPHVVADPLYRTFEDRSDFEFLRDLPQVLGRVPVLHYGGAGDYFQRSNIGQAGE